MELKNPKNLSRSERIAAKPDGKILLALKSGDQNALIMALQARTEEALAAVEETIALYSGNPEITFYQPGGMVENNTSIREQALQELTAMAGSQQLLKDPAYSQYCISRLGHDMGDVFMRTLYQEDMQACYDYQLLGIQMQLALLVKGKAA